MNESYDVDGKVSSVFLFFLVQEYLCYISPDLHNLYLMHTFPYTTHKKLQGAYILNYA